VCDGYVSCDVDGLPLLEARSDRFGQGAAGLYVDGSDSAQFDDVRITEFETLNEDFADLSRWVPVTGDWSAQDGSAACSGPGVLVGGRYEWTDYRAQTTVHPRGGPVGIHVAHTPEGAGIIFRLDPKAGKAQILRTGPTGEELVAETDVKGTRGNAVELAACVTDGGFVTGYLGGEPVLRGLCPEAKGGAVALEAGPGKQHRFDGVRVAFLRKRDKPTITREFQQTSEHGEMAEWSGRRADWVQPDEITPGATWWSKGDYFRGTSLSFKVRFVGLRDGTATVVLNADASDPDAGARLTLVLTSTKGSRLLQARLMHGDRELGQGEVELEKSSAQVQFTRKAADVLVSIDDQPVITAQI
jgi:hypothetical protein